MSKKYSVWFPGMLLLLVSLTAGARVRYLDAVFDSVEVQTVIYSEKEGVMLAMDLYLPQADTLERRPVVLYVHGGGFSGGSRDASGIPRFCRRLAGTGYVAVSISYRLTRQGKATAFGCDCPAAEKMETFRAAVEDLREATVWLLRNQSALRIDPARIILSGSSAGAETVLNAAYQPPFVPYPGEKPFSYAGVISMAGAIPDTTLLSGGAGIPSLLFHGTCDNLVPYASASHHYCQPARPGHLLLHGAHTLAGILGRTGVPCWLYTFCGDNHRINISPMEEQFLEILSFCHGYVLQGTGTRRHTIEAGSTARCDYGHYMFCDP